MSSNIITLTNNTISGNSANNGTWNFGGGGIMCTYDLWSNGRGPSTITTISNNIISNNSVGGSGGGINCYGSTINSISQNIIIGNSASTTDGGGIWCSNSNGYGTISSIDNTLISNNSANLSTGNGGGIYLDGNSGSNHPTITNVTIANNNAANGGGVYCLNTCNPTFDNCILYGNTATMGPQIFLFDEPSDPAITYSDVQGGKAAIEANGNFYTGTYTNNINALPKFVAPSAGSGSAYNGTYNWTLQGTSPCRDAGDPSGTYPATDLAGNPRVYGSNIDMGAYEYQMSVTTSQKPVSCYGGNNGTATATVVNGSSPYTYAWSANAASQTTQTATGLIAGTYTVSVTDHLNATAWTVVTVTQPNPLYISTSKTDASCVNNNGTASVSASGGTAPYYYLWSTAGTDSTITGLSSGNYSVTVTDTMGCAKTGTVSIQISIAVPPNPVPICAITVDSLSRYNIIVWSKPATSKIQSFLIYRDTANNAYGLIGTVPYDSLSEFIDTVRTKYAANGNPNVSSWRYKIAVLDSCGNTSAMSPFHQTIFIQNNSGNFNWSQYQIEGQPLPVPALTNYLFLRDNNSNGNYATIQTLSASSTLYTDPNYSTYVPTATWRVRTVWNISCAPSIINPKDPWLNTVTVNTSKSNTFRTITPLTTSVSVTDASSCSASDGSLIAHVSGGVTPYTYLWNPTGQTTSVAIALASGNYTVTVTDAHNSTLTTTATVSCPNGASELSLQNSINISPNPSNGTMKVEVAGDDGSMKAIEVYNLYGEKVYSTTVNLPDRQAGRKQESVNLNEADGIYFLKVILENGTVNKKIVITK